MSKIKNKTVLCLLTLLVILLWGSLFPMVKLGYKEFQIDSTNVPSLLFFAGIRFAICGFIILVFSTIKYRKIPAVATKNEWIGIFLIGLIAVALHYGCTYVGLSSTNSSKTSLLKQSGMIIFICLSFFFDKDDKFSWKKIAAAVLGVISILILSNNSNILSISLGEVLIIVASFCTVFSNLVCKKANCSSNPINVTGYSELIGGIILLIFGLAFGGKIGHVPFKAILVFCYIVVATIISYVLWYSLVQTSELSYLFIIKLSEPLFTAIISVLVLGENIWQWQYLVSFICVAFAVTIVNIKFTKIETVNKAQSRRKRYENR